MAYIEFKDVTRVYGSDGSEVHALDGASHPLSWVEHTNMTV